MIVWQQYAEEECEMTPFYIVSSKGDFIKSNPILAERDPEGKERGCDYGSYWFNKKTNKLFKLNDSGELSKWAPPHWECFNARYGADCIVIID